MEAGNTVSVSFLAALARSVPSKETSAELLAVRGCTGCMPHIVLDVSLHARVCPNVRQLGLWQPVCTGPTWAQPDNLCITCSSFGRTADAGRGRGGGWAGGPAAAAGWAAACWSCRRGAGGAGEEGAVSQGRWRGEFVLTPGPAKSAGCPETLKQRAGHQFCPSLHSSLCICRGASPEVLDLLMEHLK